MVPKPMRIQREGAQLQIRGTWSAGPGDDQARFLADLRALRDSAAIGYDELAARAHYPSDVIALVVLWRLRYKLSLRDLAEMFLTRGLIFTYEAVRDWEAKLTPALAENLRGKRKGRIGRSW